jgi:hypothetical protein
LISPYPKKFYHREHREKNIFVLLKTPTTTSKIATKALKHKEKIREIEK